MSDPHAALGAVLTLGSRLAMAQVSGKGLVPAGPIPGCWGRPIRTGSSQAWKRGHGVVPSPPENRPRGVGCLLKGPLPIGPDQMGPFLSTERNNKKEGWDALAEEKGACWAKGLVGGWRGAHGGLLACAPRFHPVSRSRF